jgi:hypothetical protein
LDSHPLLLLNLDLSLTLAVQPAEKVLEGVEAGALVAIVALRS